MNKVVKRKLIGSIFCFIIGVGVMISSIIFTINLSDELHSYLLGFACGILGVGVYRLYIVLRVAKNPSKGKELENNENDERLLHISNKSMSITFRLSVIVEAILSLIYAFINIEIAKYLGIIVGIQLIVYVVIYFIMSKNN